MRKKIISNGLWLSLTKISTFFITFGGSVVLARLLDPEVFGFVAMATAISAIGTKFALIGIRPEIIRLDDTDSMYVSKMSTVFWLNLLVTVVGACLLVIMVDFFGWLDSPASYVFPIIVSGWALDNCMLPARAVLHREQRYKSIFILRVFVPLTSIPFAVILALNGFGVWSLVLPQAISLATAGLIAFLMANMSISFSFNKDTVVSIFSKGKWYLVHNIMAGGYSNADRLIIGGFLGSSALGFYQRSYSLSQLFQQQLGTMFYTLGLPIFIDSKAGEESKIKFLKYGIKFVCYLICPAILVFSIFSHEIITFIYGNRWEKAAEFFVYLVPFSVFWSIYQVLKGKLIGSSDVKYLAKVDLIKLMLMVGICVSSVEYFGVLGVGAGLAIGAFVGNIMLIKKIVGENALYFLKDMFYPIIFLPISMAVCLTFERYFALLVLIVLTLIFFWFERDNIIYIVKGRSA